jgi:hypothetical protein
MATSCGANSLTAAILLAIVCLILHLAEEVKTSFRKKLPVGEMPLSLFLGLNVLIYAFCFATLTLAARNCEWAIPLTWALAIGMVLNGLGHIGIMAVRRRYFPGGFTAFLLLLAAGILIAQLVSW